MPDSSPAEANDSIVPASINVAIIGSGPSGFYAAAALFKSDAVTAHVDMFDRLPTPFGLVRGGVAPDHQKIKNVIRVYNKTADHERFRFFGNVMIGRDVAAAELAAHYHAVIYAVGNESDRRLGIPGEDLAGVHSATEFVGWYNGHPDFQDRTFALDQAKRIAVVGNGNVAMDVARVLAQDLDELGATDITDKALKALRMSTVEEITILGRRGVAQAAFSPKEIKEIGALERANLVVDPSEVALDEASSSWLEEHAPPSAKKNVEYLTEHSAQAPGEAGIDIVCRFLVSPTKCEGDGDGKLESVTIETNALYLDDRGTPRPRGTGETFDLSVDLIFKAVGYRGVPLEGVPFNDGWGTFPNTDGRLTEEEGGATVPGQYVVGWAKRGPSGLIGTNGPDSTATVSKLIEDATNGLFAERDADPEALIARLQTNGVTVSDFDDWLRLDAEEIRRGEAKGKVRDKFCSVDDMMTAICELRDS